MMEKYEIQVIRSARKTISLQVQKDGTVQVRAPYLMTNAAVRQFIDQHREWIEKHVDRVEQRAAQAGPAFTGAELKAMAEEAKRFLPGLIDTYAPRLGVHPTRVTVRNQRTRWGSCSSKGSLNFNCLLALAPEPVRRYVVIHELCHLKEMNHSPAFWKLVASEMPDYQNARKWLKTEGQRLIERLSR